MEIVSNHITPIVPTTEEDIYKGIPFWGILFSVDENGDEAYVDTIPEDNPITIRDLRRRNKRGDFILRIPRGSDYDEIPFRIEKPRPRKTQQAQQYDDLQNRIAEIRSQYRERLEEIEHEHQRHIARLKEEIEQLYRQLQQYQNQIVTLTQQAAQEKISLIQAHQTELQQLRDQLHELRAENQILTLRLEGELEDVEEGGLLEKLISGEGGAKLIEALQGILTQQQPQPNLNGQQKTPQEAMIERFFIAATKTLASQEWEKYGKWVQGQIAFMQANNIQIDRGQWVRLAYALAEHAIENEISADRIAKLLDPLLDQFAQARQMLGILGPEKATDALAAMAGVELPRSVRHVIVETLTYLKQRDNAS